MDESSVLSSVIRQKFYRDLWCMMVRPTLNGQRHFGKPAWIKKEISASTKVRSTHSAVTFNSGVWYGKRCITTNFSQIFLQSNKFLSTIRVNLRNAHMFSSISLVLSEILWQSTWTAHTLHATNMRVPWMFIHKCLYVTSTVWERRMQLSYDVTMDQITNGWWVSEMTTKQSIWNFERIQARRTNTMERSFWIINLYFALLQRLDHWCGTIYDAKVGLCVFFLWTKPNLAMKLRN